METVDTLKVIDALIFDKLQYPPHFTARELCRMRKAPGQPVAIPPRELWSNILATVELAEKLRAMIGLPLSVASGYRPADYNKAVGGAPKSTHVAFRAVDLDLAAEYRDPVTVAEYRRAACALYLSDGWRCKMGLGLYARPAYRVHIDTGYRQRYWKAEHVAPILAVLIRGHQ